MGRVAWRYGWVTVVGALAGAGWWFCFGYADRACVGGVECEIGLLLAAPLLPVVSWLAAWFLLHRAGVDRPGVTAVSGVGVALLLGLTGLGAAALPQWPAAIALGALSFLIGGMVSS